VYVVDAEGHRLPPGEIGELVVRGSHVMRGYWRAPELTAARYRPGPVLGEHVLYTGDLFRVDTEGYLYFVGRKDDIIKSRGEKVSPREVENAVCQLAGVAAAVVVGVPDTLLGEAVALAVEGREGVELSEAALRAYCARSLEGFMVPKYVKILASLPRTPNGKVDRQAIAQEFARCAAS
jgi:acyl-CoA synthetase (AMP-forming)/AMP-acid ligase II